MTTNWNAVLKTRNNIRLAKKFATGTISGAEFYSNFANTEEGGEIRTLLRKGGVQHARQLTRKALSRRMIDVPTS